MSRIKLLNLISESFVYTDLTPEDQDKVYNIFKSSYEKTTGVSWDKYKFDSRADGWLFFGNKDSGFLTVRKQNSGMYKLTGVAGDTHGVTQGIAELTSMNVPIWGMMDDKLASILQQRYGFIRPPKWLIKMSMKLIPASVFGGVDFDINPDGSISMKYTDVGTAQKFFVGNKQYFKFLLDNVFTQTTAVPLIAVKALKKMIGVN